MNEKSYDWKAIQTELKRLGLYEGRIDGVRGPATERGLIAFQKSVGLLVKTFEGTTTYFGPKSYAALMSKVPAAMRQGENRLDRGRKTFAKGEAEAMARGWSFGWRLVEAEGIAHEGGQMMRAPEMAEAMAPAVPNCTP